MACSPTLVSYCFAQFLTGSQWDETFWLASSPLAYINPDVCRMRSSPCAGGFEYHHRSPANHRRRRKRNPVPGDISGPLCSWDIYIEGPGPPGWGRQQNVATSPTGLGSENDALERTSSNCKRQTNLSSESMLHKDYENKSSIKKTAGRESKRGFSPRRTGWR
jgi:hypothetical protein